jgi:ABC-type cobalamin/Fe3+-siderophores transport system ATPase subunit
VSVSRWSTRRWPSTDTLHLDEPMTSSTSPTSSTSSSWSIAADRERGRTVVMVLHDLAPRVSLRGLVVAL